MSTSRGENFTWSREMLTSLISLYKAHKCLYLCKNKDYTNRFARNNALELITNALNDQFFTALSVKDIQRKLHIVRTQYWAEIKKINTSKTTGNGVYRSKLWCFELLKFLSSPERSTPSIKVDYHEEESHCSSSGVQKVDQECSSEEVLLKYDDVDVEDVVVNPDPLELPSTTSYSYTREFEPNSNAMFGKVIAQEMDKIHNEEILDQLKEVIISAVFRAKAENRRLNQVI